MMGGRRIQNISSIFEFRRKFFLKHFNIEQTNKKIDMYIKEESGYRGPIKIGWGRYKSQDPIISSTYRIHRYPDQPDYVVLWIARGGCPLGNLEEAPARLPGLFALAKSLAASPWVSIEILADLGGGCGEAICCCICCIAWRSGSMVSSGRFGRPGEK